MAQDSLSDFPAAEYRFETRRKNTIILNTTNSFDVFFSAIGLSTRQPAVAKISTKILLRIFMKKKCPTNDKKRIFAA